MARRDGGDYQRCYVDFIDGQWQVVSVVHQRCWWDDYSSMVHDLGPLEYEGRYIPDGELDDFEHERLVEEYVWDDGRPVRNLWEIVHDGGRLFVGDNIYDEAGSDQMFAVEVW